MRECIDLEKPVKNFTSELPPALPRIPRTIVSSSQEIEFPALNSFFFEKTVEYEEFLIPK